MGIILDFMKFFEVAVLPRIYGEPDSERLSRMKDGLKTNASRVKNELGVGAHGYLGLILTPLEYASISAIPYVRHLHPGALNIPAGTPQHAATMMRELHK